MATLYRRPLKALSLIALAAAWFAFGISGADEPAAVDLAIKDHRFTPSELRVPAGKALILNVRNEDPTPEELESRPLKVEKVIPGHRSATVRIRPLEAGRYAFVGEFHEGTARGVLIAE